MNYRCASDLASGDALGRCRHSRSFTNFLIKGGGQLTFAKTKEYTIFCLTLKGGYENIIRFKQLQFDLTIEEFSKSPDSNKENGR